MKRVEKRKGKNRKDGEGKGETKKLKREGKNKYKQSGEEEGRKSRRYQSQYEQNELKISCPSQESLYQLLQLNFGQLHLKRLHEKSREEKGKESEGRRR
jgi:hypothetical protein